jgi:hypothetical protein
MRWMNGRTGLATTVLAVVITAVVAGAAAVGGRPATRPAAAVSRWCCGWPMPTAT